MVINFVMSSEILATVVLPKKWPINVELGNVYGADAKTVTAVMGHEDIRTMLNHYAKTTPESLANAAQVLVDAVDGARDTSYRVSVAH